MHIFVTGATGMIGLPTVKALLAAGHTVLGLARSDKSAATLSALGASVHRGSIEDTECLVAGAKASDGVIHLGFVHDFENFARGCAIDQAAITAMGEALEGTNKPLITSSGTLHLLHGKLSDESVPADLTHGLGALRGKAEPMTLEFAEKGVRAMVVRFAPTVHGDNDWAFVPILINMARERGAAAYIGDGSQRWPAVHKVDAAELLRLAVEKGKAGAIYHATAEGTVPIKSVVDVITGKLGVPAVSKTPEEAKEYFGMLAVPLSSDNPVSSEKTRKELGWTPTQVTLLEDMETGTYFR